MSHATTRWLCAGCLILFPRAAWAADDPAPTQAAPASAPPAAATQAAPSIERQLADLTARVAAQQAQIDAQQKQITADREEIAVLRRETATDLAAARATGIGTQAAVPATQTSSAPPQETVGDAQAAKPDIADKTQAVPQGQGVLTPAGKTTVQASLTYIRSANDRLVFAGIELVPGLQIGSIQASTADRNTTIDALTIWHGFTSRLEGELMIPAMIRTDSIHLSQVRDGTVTEGFDLHESAIGDIEGALRWQINAPLNPEAPIFIAGLRVKSDTGVSPFSIAYDEFGIAHGLATGSGFWGVQPGLTVLLPSDPAVIYGGISYLYQFARDIDRTVNGTLIGHVRPGGAITANIGFGFAINPRFSFSLGYSHTYIMPTRTELNGSFQDSSTLQAGTLDLGMSYRVNQRQSVTLAFQFGVTQDAPGVAMTLRLPFTF
ncbi:transporter [Sphingomonas sp. CL5.1]|uniref:transporter n=1 Tax=Sphingomonas sp. CL5.1 TaxID=2653203 RepID=UPI0015824AAC|nr:transporter [Sphingomonas sp. CL5.1]QKS00505.1 transporter [Sphingomonas sp. CL5.1]